MLCTQVINGLSTALNILSLAPGKDFEIVTVSFNPRDTPATASAKKAVYLERYTRDGAARAWHFLSGDQPSIDRLTKAAGFRYVWDAETKQFAHPTGVIVLTADGRLSRYLFGIEYGPRDLRYALVEASAGGVGNAVDTLLLYCYHYDPMTGRYGFVVMRAVRIASAARVVAVASFSIVPVRNGKRAGSDHDGHLRVGRERLLRDGAPPGRNAEHLRRRQAVDVEVPASRRPARDQRAACPRWPSGEADHDVGGRHPRFLRARVPRQG